MEIDLAPEKSHPWPELAKPLVEILPTAESTEVNIETLKADLATATRQIEFLNTTLVEAQHDSDTWKHKYGVVNGMFKKQGPEQAKLIRELKAEIERLKATPVSDELDAADKQVMIQRGISEQEYRKVMGQASRRWIRKLLGFK